MEYFVTLGVITFLAKPRRFCTLHTHTQALFERISEQMNNNNAIKIRIGNFCQFFYAFAILIEDLADFIHLRSFQLIIFMVILN